MPRKQRDYAAEYARRKRNALAAGKTMQEARGHREEIRVGGPTGEVSTYYVRHQRSVAAQLRRYDESLTRADSIYLAGQYFDRWGIAATRRLMRMQEAAHVAYENRSLDYGDLADAMGDYYNELNEDYENRMALVRRRIRARDDWDDYREIDFGDPPDYSICLFYH